MGAVFLAMTSKGSASPPRSDLKSARQEEITYKHGRHHKRVTFSAPCPCQSTGETAGAAMGVMSAVSQATPHMPPQTFIPPPPLFPSNKSKVQVTKTGQGGSFLMLRNSRPGSCADEAILCASHLPIHFWVCGARTTPGLASSGECLHASPLTSWGDQGVTKRLTLCLAFLT